VGISVIDCARQRLDDSNEDDPRDETEEGANTVENGGYEPVLKNARANTKGSAKVPRDSSQTYEEGKDAEGNGTC